MGLTHEDFLVNADVLCEIDIHTRKIIRKSKKTDLSQYDHNSERIGFTMARYNDGHDMSMCDRVAIKYLNVRNDDMYIVDDVAVSEDGNSVTFTWLVSGNATQEVGSLIFAINFRCWNDNGVITYNWTTQPNSTYSIINGVKSMDSNPKEQYDFWAKYRSLVDGVIEDTERVGDQLAVLIEDEKSLDDRLDGLVETANNLDTTIRAVGQNVPVLENQVDILNQQVPNLEDKVETLERALEDDVAYSLSKSIDTVEEEAGFRYLKKVQVNLFDKNRVESGYYNQYLQLEHLDEYENTGPIYLARGNYLFNLNKAVFGINGGVVVKKTGDEISLYGTATLLGETRIGSIYIDAPGYYIFNVGGKTQGDIRNYNFMLVSGLTELDFPSEYIPHSKKLEEDVDFSEHMIGVIEDKISERVDPNERLLNQFIEQRYVLVEGLTIKNEYVYIDGTFGGGAYSVLIKANKGEKFIFDVKSGSRVHPYVMFNSKGEVIDYYEPTEEWGTTHSYDIEVEIPENDVKLYINTTNKSNLTVKQLKPFMSISVIPHLSLNPLYNKKVVFDGDSISHGTSAGDGLNGWAGRIGEANHMDWYNESRSGGTIMSGLYSGTAKRHWVSTHIDTIYDQYPDLDYLILEGGTNDADLVGTEKLGSISTKSFMYDDFNSEADFTQALEHLFSKAISYYPNKKIGFIIAQKMGTSASSYKTSNRRIFFDRCVEVCEKYGIPYLDLWNTCHLNPTIDRASHNGVYHMYTDGQHLSAAGYDYVSPIIEAWMKTL